MSQTNGSIESRSSMNSHDRKLRYRALLEDLSILDDSSNNVETINKTTNAVQEAQALLAEGGVEERVKHPGEGYLDSRVLRATSDLAVRCSETISGNANVYDKHELAHHIKENPDFWCFSLPLEVPVVSYLFGTFAGEPPERRERPPRRKLDRQKAALKAPESVDRLDKMEEGAEMVSRMNRFINKTYKNRSCKPISYFHLVLDPDSFCRTVENIYHLSFLARDGKIKVDLDEEHELPFVSPVMDCGADRADISDENQFIVSMDMQRWQELIKAFNIQKPMMVLKRQ